jgi:hypothetical protein
LGYLVKEIQPTPNPNAIKLILNQPISDRPVSFLQASTAVDHPLASKLFAISGVNSILLLGDFITINKSSEVRWADITGKVKKLLAEAG